MSDSRLESLELKLMELEHTVQQLNDVVLRQYRDIDALRQSQALLLEKLANSDNTASIHENSATLADEPPPHY
ncbi:MAG: SlyX family protein [Granulosicoccus sp.]